MQCTVIPSINCENFNCVKERLKITEKIFGEIRPPTEVGSPEHLPADLPAKASASAEASAKAGWVHIDVSDGKFTPHISWGNPEELAPICRTYEVLHIEVHLMVENPEAQVDAWLRAGAKRIIVHLEAMRDPVYILEKCKKYGAECFLAINPVTEVERLFVHVDDFSGVLILGVFPGPSGQEMKPEVLNKIKYLRERNPDINIEIDGGVNPKTAKLAKEAGASHFVAGAFIFSSNNPQRAYQELVRVVS